MNRTSPWPTAESTGWTYPLSRLKGWCPCSVLRWFLQSMGLFGVLCSSSTRELAGGPAQILKTWKCPSWSVNIISCQPTTSFPVHRTELWLVSTSAQKKRKRKKRGEQLLPHFISELLVHHILAKMTFYMEEQSNNHMFMWVFTKRQTYN